MGLRDVRSGEVPHLVPLGGAGVASGDDRCVNRRPLRMNVVNMGKKREPAVSRSALSDAPAAGKPSALLDTRVIYCGDNGRGEIISRPDWATFISPLQDRARGFDLPQS